MFWTKETTLSPSQRRELNFARIHYWKHNEPNNGDLVLLTECSNVNIQNITLQGSTSWTCHLLGCDHVTVDGMKICNPLYSPNTDGIDVDGSQEVQITNCDICTGDDAIVLKNRNAKVHFPHDCKDITIDHCHLTSQTNGLKSERKLMETSRTLSSRTP